MAPGVNRLGRETGTVPKTKTPNNSGRDNAMGVSRTSRSNIPNNLTSQDWQSASGSSTNRTRKNSNTRASLLDYYDAADSRIAHENSRFVSSENQDQCGPVNKVCSEVNGLEAAPPTTSARRDCVRRPPRNVMPDTENKSNITKMPDRNQISSRLNQIRDYIQQTSSIMDSLKSSGQPSHLVQYHKLAGMVADLRDSEDKLASLLTRYDNVSSDSQMDKTSEAEEDNVSVEADRAPTVNGNSNEVLNGQPEINGVHVDGFETRDNIQKENGAVLKTTDGSRCNELRMRLEESQKKLQAMQEHQAALQALQQQTQQQLKEARAAQSTLLARTAAAAAAAATSSMNSDEDQNPETLRSNLDTIRDRLYALHMYEQRDPDKLQELQTKKERMSHLVAEFQTETNGAVGPITAGLQSGREKSGESSKDGSEMGEEDGNLSDIECDVQRVRSKMAQLSAMRIQLRRLQNLVDSGLQDTEMARIQEDCPVHSDEVDGVEADEEEEAVNIRRQRQGKGRSVSRTNSTSSTATKPDNISQASVGNMQESELRIEKKTLKLREAKSKLHQLQKLLSTVMDLRSRGEPVPEHYLQILEEETSRVDQEQAAEAAQAMQEARAHHQAIMDRDREGAAALIPTASTGPTQENPDVTLEMVQTMALELQTQTQYLKEEKKRLIRARQEIGNISRELPYREKKTNTQLLLQAKRRELEELMRKDQGQSSAVNQDICSEMSAGKSDTAGFSYVGEGTSAATWGGSTQGTLDDLAERDDDVQEQSAGYSSDEAQDEEESNQRYLGSQRKHPQHNTTSSSSNNHNSNNNNNAAVSIKKESLAQSTSTNREALSMSLESGVFGGSQCGNVNSNAGSVSGTFPPPQPLTNLAQQRSGPRNVWRKSSTDSSATLPRAVWTPSSLHPNTVDELATNANTTAVNTSINHNENESNTNNISQVNQSQSTSSTQNSWWQQQAMQLQSQLDATNNLYQSLLIEQQQQQQNLACWPQPPALAQLPGFRGPLPGVPSDAFYQQLLAATQFQQQQLLLTTLNQCCHLLWMQQREMASLRGIVMTLQDKLSHGNEGYPSTITFSQQPEDSLLISSTHTSAHQTPRQSQSNLSHSNANSTPVPNASHSHPPLKVSYSGGLLHPPEEHSSSSGAFSFHSLPNLPHPPVLGPCFPDPASILNSNGPNFISRAPQPQPLTQCSIPQATTHGAGGAPWLQQGSAGGAPGLLSAHASSASPVPALNNQVPPGNRANNYWDNFRSYSRQNLLSTSTKSNEGVSHSPSPLVDRSRNTLRNSGGLVHPHPSQHTAYPLSDQGLPLNLSRKEKLNIERYHAVADNYALPSGAIPDMAELQYQQSLPNNQYLNANMQVEHQQIGARALPSSVSNNMSSSDGRGTSSWQNRPSTRSYRTQRGMNCKRKNPRLPPPPVATEHPPSSSSVASTPQDRGTRKHRDALCHRSGRSLFDVLSESVYTEVAALIAVNESRPHFLIQLFRDLQMVSSDPLRQRTLQSIHELVSRYLAEASGGQEGSRMHQNVKACKSKEPVLNDSLASSDEDDNTKMRASTSVTVPSAHTPPRNAAWNAHDDMSLPSVLQQGHNEWELEAVLEDLLPFLKGHLDEICSPALLDAVRQQAVQLMLAQTQSHCRHNMPGSAHQPAGGYFQGQLDALLEDGLNKFQGCRLRDVCEDLLMVITDILQSELTFLKLVDTVRREVDESSEDTCKNPTAPEEPANSAHTLQLSVESAAQAFPPPEANCQNRLESLGSAEGYNGDLAEADQSHHEEAAGGASPQQGEGDVAGAIVPEDSDDDGLLEIMQNDVLRPEENQDGLAVSLGREDCEEHAKTEAEDEWAVEQDREQGLDRVPTRLTDEIDGQDRPSGLQTNHSDASSNP